MPNQVIYPSSGSVAYVLLLVFVKCLRTIGLFLSYGVLKTIHVVEFVFLVKIGAALCMVVLQKPFKSNQKLSRQQWARVVRHAVFSCLITLLWLYGLTLCGTLRTNLVYEHSETVVLAGAAALFTSSGSPAKTRAAVFFLIGVISLLLFDHDDIELHHKSSDHQHHNGISHLFYHIANWMDVADHKAGVALLFVTLCLNVGFSTVAKKLAVDVGGAKRLQTLSTLVSVVILLPLVLVLFVTQQSSIKSWPLFVIPLALIIVFVFIMNYYVESLCTTKLDACTMARVGAISSFLSALVISFFWRYGLTEIDSRTGERRVIVRPEHPLSGGVIFALLVFIQATYTLSGHQSGSSRGTFIGYSAAGLPLYHLNSTSLQKSSESIMKVLRNGLRQILEEQDSRQIFYFLCINLMFTFVELIYGVWSNSLGLISDGFHMLFDCSALVMGLYAAVMSRWKATRIFSYGYGRVEILSGFVNGLFLIVIALFVFVEAWGRLINPPEILTERLLSVAVIGLIVNLIGVFAFSHAHGGSHGHSHGGSHSHSGGHGHSHHHGHSHEKAKINTNMQGVFLHVMADTLGSVGVILSTLLIENFGWYIADPICSLFIASTIFFSVLPLLRDTSLMLLLRAPAGREKEITQALDTILHIHGVLAYRDEHFWNHSSNTIACTLHVQVAPDAVEQQVRNQAVKILRSCGVSNISVQVEKEEYYQHMSGLSSSFQRLFKEAHNVHLLNVNSSHYQELVKEV